MENNIRGKEVTSYQLPEKRNASTPSLTGNCKLATVNWTPFLAFIVFLALMLTIALFGCGDREMIDSGLLSVHLTDPDTAETILTDVEACLSETDGYYQIEKACLDGINLSEKVGTYTPDEMYHKINYDIIKGKKDDWVGQEVTIRRGVWWNERVKNYWIHIKEPTGAQITRMIPDPDRADYITLEPVEIGDRPITTAQTDFHFEQIRFFVKIDDQTVKDNYVVGATYTFKVRIESITVGTFLDTNEIDHDRIYYYFAVACELIR